VLSDRFHKTSMTKCSSSESRLRGLLALNIVALKIVAKTAVPVNPRLFAPVQDATVNSSKASPIYCGFLCFQGLGGFVFQFSFFRGLPSDFAEASCAHRMHPQAIEGAFPPPISPTAMAPRWLRTSLPQNTAREVGTEDTPQRRSHFRSIVICSDGCCFNGLARDISSQALISLGIDFSNHGPAERHIIFRLGARVGLL
jgi:hypothetical protein